MWWLITAVSLFSIVAGFFIFRRTRAEHRRMAVWQDLHERKKIIALQLAYFRDLAAKKADE